MRAAAPRISSERWTDEQLDAERERILSGWPTGEQVDLDEAVAYHSAMPELKNVPRKRRHARATGGVLVQPLAGVTTLAGHIELMRHLQDDGGADILPTQIDSQTRNLRFAAAEEAIRASSDSGLEKLNGYPIVNHGVLGTRQVVEAVDVPIEMRIGTVDPRLAAEIAFASGMSSVTAGPIYYTVHYSRDTTFQDSIRNWQYVFRLIGRYGERGVPLGLQIHGVGNSTPFPNTLLGVCCALECLIAAGQGARSFSTDARFMGHLVQDVAAVGVIREICEEYLAASGYGDAILTVDRKSWAGRYPEDMARAYGLICYNTVSGMLAGVDEFITNSVQEGVGIPVKEANAATLRAMKQVIGLMSGQRAQLNSEAVEREAHYMRIEMRSILDAILQLGDGDPALGTALAFEAGIMDIPFAASRKCRGEVMVARDDEGAVRYLDPGRLPIPAEVLAYHAKCLGRRSKARGAEIDYEAIVDDIFSISRGYLVRN